MKYKNGYIGLAVLAILISVIAFAVPTEKTASFGLHTYLPLLQSSDKYAFGSGVTERASF